ncbi:DUF5710 domain-containing protein [Burkholderia cenocepacia]|uniref:DUF5710 domain-containing protein n=1 Tax=Burkholderia cenocepacia TaxID=95486 RepID=UPI0023B9577C|nr:DUF5710 domain-containing protein [Burkholderia cenocepacia]MDF0506834.1 DUF5710 domain-containing protein [Burkholderia cenocepacia]
MYNVDMAKRRNLGQDRAVTRFLASAGERVRPRLAGGMEPGSATSPRIYLAVPRRDIARARALGARIDRIRRVCWIDAAADRRPFAEWIVDDAVMAGAGIDRDAVIADFMEAMRSYGLIPETIHPDGEWHTAKVETRHGPRSNGSYVLSQVGSEWRGYIRNYRGRSGPWRFQSGHLTREQRAALEAAERDRRVTNAEKALTEHRAIAAKVLSILVALPTADGVCHPYLERKVVDAHGLRVATSKEMAALLNLEHFKATRDSYLIVPCRGADDRLRTVQALAPDGAKLFTKGARKTGAFHVIGVRRAAELVNAPAVLFVEGYATGASVYEATGLPVVVCLDADNLVAVAKELVEILPKDQPKLVCGDNDQYFLDTAVERISELGGFNQASLESLAVVAGTAGAVRAVEVIGAIPDGEWHLLGCGKYRLAAERVCGVVRSVTVDIVKATDGKHVRISTRNKGVESAEHAARILHCKAIAPVFGSLDSRSKDFNDLASTEGKQAVREQVQAHLPFILQS